jgi:hypothetical protein
MTLAQLDAACLQHLAHGAMAGHDPLTDSLLAQLEAPAAEGALPQVGFDAGRAAALADAERDPWMWRLMPAAMLLAIVGSVFYPWGVA